MHELEAQYIVTLKGEQLKCPNDAKYRTGTELK